MALRSPGHRALGLSVPAGAPPPPVTASTVVTIRRRDVLGGLIHEYRRTAA